MSISKFWNSTILVGILALAAGCGEKVETPSTKAEETELPAAPVKEGLDFEVTKTKDSYAIGLGAGEAMRANIDSIDGTGIELDVEIIAQSFADGLKGDSQLDEAALTAIMDDFRVRINAAMTEKRAAEAAEQAKQAEANIATGLAFLEANKAKDGVVALDSGLQYRVIKEGTGKSPGPTDQVSVHYTGTLIDGSKFDSSRDRGQPAQFGVNQVISGWTEALQLMKEGSVWELYIPAEIAYGAASRPSIPGNSVLIFDVELIEVVASN